MLCLNFKAVILKTIRGGGNPIAVRDLKAGGNWFFQILELPPEKFVLVSYDTIDYIELGSTFAFKLKNTDDVKASI